MSRGEEKNAVLTSFLTEVRWKQRQSAACTPAAHFLVSRDAKAAGVNVERKERLAAETMSRNIPDWGALGSPSDTPPRLGPPQTPTIPTTSPVSFRRLSCPVWANYSSAGPD